MLTDLYSQMKGTVVSPGTKNMAAAIQKEVSFPVPDLVALVAALSLTAEIHIQLSPIKDLEKVSKDALFAHSQATTAFLVALQAVGLASGLTNEQVQSVADVLEKVAIADLQQKRDEFETAGSPVLQ